ncbi:DNA helicase MCM9 [Acrasis kona]|uniref:DNA helicase n=1 Tax=Acrasis kona TaxID=1008807 RepID=A0AAW2YM29_9EUKA
MSGVYCVYDKSETPEYYNSVLKDYLKKHHREDIERVLMEEDDTAHYPIKLSCLDLLNFNIMVGSLLLAYPKDVLPHFDQAAREIQHLVLEDSLTFKYKPNVHLRVHTLPLNPETTKPSVSAIRSADINKFIAVSGTVIRTGAVKMWEFEKQFMCNKCKQKFTVRSDMEQYNVLIKPTSCPNEVEECGGKSFKLLENSQVCRDYQEIKIQDKIAQLSVGSIPRSILVLLEDDLVDQCKAGDDVVISGTVIRRWKPFRSDVRCSIETAVLCNHIQINNEQKSNVHITNAMREEFEKYWITDKPLSRRNHILKSMCPQLFGLYFVKLSVAMTLIGGVPLVKSGTRIRGESHLLIVGDPGTGKSQFLKYACKLSPRYVMTNGIGTTSAGLTVMASKETGSGDWTLEAGALVLADGGVCCIDEFDAIREHDRATIHEAMEQQTLSIAKAGLVCKLNTRATVFAACNPKGKYDTQASLSTNVAMASPLLSRFDIVLVLLDKQDQEWDQRVSSFILNEEEMKGEEEDEEDGHQENGTMMDDLWTFEKIQAYICYVKDRFQPTIGKQAGLIMKQYYRMQRQADKRVAARTTIRMLESLARLAQAHARLMHRNIVHRQDAIVAVIAIDASTHTSPLLDIRSVLQSNFPSDPDDEFDSQMRIILQKLNLEHLIDAPEDEDGIDDDVLNDSELEQKRARSTRSNVNQSNVNQNDDDDDDGENNNGNDDGRKRRVSHHRGGNVNVNVLSKNDYDDDDDGLEDTMNNFKKHLEKNGRSVLSNTQKKTSMAVSSKSQKKSQEEEGDEGFGGDDVFIDYDDGGDVNNSSHHSKKSQSLNNKQNTQGDESQHVFSIDSNIDFGNFETGGNDAVENVVPQENDYITMRSPSPVYDDEDDDRVEGSDHEEQQQPVVSDSANAPKQSSQKQSSSLIQRQVVRPVPTQNGNVVRRPPVVAPSSSKTNVPPVVPPKVPQVVTAPKQPSPPPITSARKRSLEAEPEIEQLPQPKKKKVSLAKRLKMNRDAPKTSDDQGGANTLGDSEGEQKSAKSSLSNVNEQMDENFVVCIVFYIEDIDIFLISIFTVKEEVYYRR